MKKSSLEELTFKSRYTYFKNVPFSADDLACPGTKFQVVKFKPQTDVKPHYHKKTYEIFYVQSGKGLLRLNDEEYRCKPDDFFLCKPYDVHEFVNDTDQEFTILIFKTNEPEESDMYWK